MVCGTLSLGAPHIGLANGAIIKKTIREGGLVTWQDLEVNSNLTEIIMYKVRSEVGSSVMSALMSEPLT